MNQQVALIAQPKTVEGNEKSGPSPTALPPLSQAAASTPDRLLMEKIYERWQAYLAEATVGSALPSAFLAALTANESGGDSSASCFELATYTQLVAVASGQTTAFGSIGRSSLFSALQYDVNPQAERTKRWLPPVQFASEFVRGISGVEEEKLRELATSWGLTQIMGYQIVGRKATVRDLIDPQFHYHFAVQLLTEFARRFCLELSRDFEALFRCWNTGNPESETFDPDYVTRGMRRMQLYGELVKVSRTKEPVPSPDGDPGKCLSARAKPGKTETGNS